MSYEAVRDLLQQERTAVAAGTPSIQNTGKAWLVLLRLLMDTCAGWVIDLPWEVTIEERTVYDAHLGDIETPCLQLVTPLGNQLVLSPAGRFSSEHGMAELRCCDHWCALQRTETSQWQIRLHDNGPFVALDRESFCAAALVLLRNWEQTLGWMSTGPFRLANVRHEGVQWRFVNGSLEFRTDPDLLS